VHAYNRHNGGDLDDLTRLQNLIETLRPQIIVNAAAYTAVDKAESETAQAYKINGDAVALIAQLAKQLDAWFIHYSTDYVYDGSKATPYLETDQTNPLSIYGKSKLAGENAIRESGCMHLIFRTSWVYSPHKNNFAAAILKRAMQHDKLEVVSDTYGVPTAASLIADVTAIAIHKIQCGMITLSHAGTYHLTPAGETSWFEYAKVLIQSAREHGLKLTVDDSAIFPVNADYYPAVAARPKNSRLVIDKLNQTFNIVLPDWKTDVSRFVKLHTQQSLL
jgi:dTDP-4-dehydrorhamnose reductase